MLLKESKFNEFSKKPLIDIHKEREVLLAFEVNGVEEVERLAKKVLEFGGVVDLPIDYGFMYQRIFKDLDGHHFELFTWK